MLKKILYVQADIAGDLPKQNGGNVTAFLERNSGSPPVCVAELLVRSPLPDFREPHSAKDGDDLSRFENRNSSHGHPTAMF